MATKTLATRLVLEHSNDTGEQPAQTLDTNGLPTALLLSGYTDFTVKAIALAAAAADQAVTFTNALVVAIVSRDEPFSLRLAAGQKLLTNLRLFVIQSADEDEEANTTSVLLTGNGDNVANLDAWIIEKPS